MGQQSPFRYFYIKRTGTDSELTQEIELRFQEENSKFLRRESELKRKYGIIRYFIFKNHTRYIKACKKLLDEDFKYSLDMIATFAANKIPDGFTTIDLGEGKNKAQEELQGLNMFKIDLRTKKGRQIFDEFFEMRNGETGEDKQLGEYVVNGFGLYHVLVPYHIGDIKEVYNTIITEKRDLWLVACPRLLPTTIGEPKGLSDDYIAELPVVEITKREYINKLREPEAESIPWASIRDEKVEEDTVVGVASAIAETAHTEEFAASLTDSIMNIIKKEKRHKKNRCKLKLWEIHQTSLFGDEIFEQ